MEGKSMKEAKLWLQGLSQGREDQIESTALKGLKVLEIRSGFLRCNFIVPDHLSDKEGNWEVGAIATLVDISGAIIAYASTGRIRPSLEFSILYYSTAKVHEEVEIEATVLVEGGKLAFVVIHVKRKTNGQLIALGKLWMVSHTNVVITSKL